MKTGISRKKINAARLSIFSNSFLILTKLFVGIITGSVSIISEAIHSVMDLLAAIVAFFSVRISDNPPDKEHPYGHAKVENVSGVIEALLIFIAAGWIIYEAILKIKDDNPVESLGLGFAVMMISALLNVLVSRRLYKVAKETGSLALEADALHLKTDVYTSLGVALGMALIWITGLHFLDPIIAMLVALLILKEAIVLLKKAFSPLLDASIAKEDIEIIEKYLYSEKYKFHNLRTRKAGNQKFIDFHLELPEDTPVKDAHAICDIIEQDIKNQIPYTEITIHVECLEN